jgi:phage repressor protein C with HTH and peptisase S24 domain
MNTLAERIKYLLEQTNPKTRPIDLARHCKIAPPSVSDWLSGKTKKLEGSNLLSVSRFFGCNQDWLATGKGKPFPPENEIKKIEIDLENNPDYPTIKRVKLKVSAGITGFTIDSYEPDTSLQAFKADWFFKHGFKPEKLLALTVSGESMEPTLYDGDTVVVNTADTSLKDGEVFVFNLDGEVVIKRAVKDSGQWWLDSDNKNNTRFTRKACPEGICIPIGRVVQKQSMKI